MNTRVSVFILVAATILCLLTQLMYAPGSPDPGFVNPQSESESTPPLISCTPDTPVTDAVKPLQLNAWAIDKSATYSWSVPVGRSEGQGRTLLWNLAGVKPGEYTATVQARDSTGRSATCMLQVIVVRPTAGRAARAGRQTGRSLLMEDEEEEAGFGLYSYVLFGIPPVDKLSKERYLEIVKAYLSLIGEIADLERYFKKNQLNVTYLPLKASRSSLPEEIKPEWALEHYDYARAKFLLQGLSGAAPEGPCIISYTRPLSGVASLSGQYLKVDLSRRDVGLVFQSVREFLKLAARERYWENSWTLMSLALNMRNVVAELGRAYTGLTPAMEELEGWISIIKGEA